jgi:hypothetical protein
MSGVIDIIFVPARGELQKSRVLIATEDGPDIAGIVAQAVRSIRQARHASADFTQACMRLVHRAGGVTP